MEMRDHKTLFFHLIAANTTPTMTGPSIMPNAPFRFLDLPTELRLQVYKHVANNMHRRRFFSSVPFSFPETDFAILAACKLIYTEAYDCIHKIILDRSVTVQLVYDNVVFQEGKGKIMATVQAMRKVTGLLIIGRSADSSSATTEGVPMDAFSSGRRDMTDYHAQYGQSMGSVISNADLSTLYRTSILQMRQSPHIIVEIVIAPGNKPPGDVDLLTLLRLGIGGPGIDVQTCIKITFVFVVSSEHLKSFKPTLPPDIPGLMNLTAICERAIEVRGE